jgi:hypothetical protein
VKDPVGAAQIDWAADEALAIHCDTTDEETEAVQELAEADEEDAASWEELRVGVGDGAASYQVEEVWESLLLVFVEDPLAEGEAQASSDITVLLA